MRSAAHFDVIADRVGRNIFAFGNIGEAFEFILLTFEKLLTFRAGYDLLDERLVKRDKTRDFSLDLREIVG